MTKITLNDEQVEYLREIAFGKHKSEITRLMNEKFNLDLSEWQITRAKIRYGAPSGPRVPRISKRLTTPEQDEYMRANSAGKTGAELIQIMKDQFGITFTKAQIKAYKARKRINTGLTGRFEKGQIPPNKGKKMPKEAYAKAQATMFKKGHRPANTRPVGSEQWRDDGYLWVKIKEPRTWRQKHVLVWEAANGPRPEGHKIIFADQDSDNFDLDNLILVHAAEHAVMCKRRLYSTNPELTKTGLTLARLILKASGWEKEEE